MHAKKHRKQQQEDNCNSILDNMGLAAHWQLWKGCLVHAVYIGNAGSLLSSLQRMHAFTPPNHPCNLQNAAFQNTQNHAGNSCTPEQGCTN